MCKLARLWVHVVALQEFLSLSMQKRCQYFYVWAKNVGISLSIELLMAFGVASSFLPMKKINMGRNAKTSFYQRNNFRGENLYFSSRVIVGRKYILSMQHISMVEISFLPIDHMSTKKIICRHNSIRG